jgi:hypothetical protein
VKQYSYVIKYLYLYKRYCLFLLSVLFLFTACKEPPGDEAPTLEFLTGSSYISKDTVLGAGSPFLIGIAAEKVDNDLTNFQARRTFAGGEEVIIDTGIHNEKFIYSCSLSKGVYASEKWYFRIMDKLGHWTEISFTLAADPNSVYDSVRTLSSVILGAQQCSTNGSFLDLKNNVVYFQDQAFLLQDSIEMLYYYINNGEGNAISSPGANIDTTVYIGPTSVLNWSVRNETRYYKLYNMSTATFDAVVNDSLLITSFNQLYSKRKAKNLVAGDIYSFRTVHGKFGLFKVINVNDTETGTVEVSIKIQK